MVNHHRSGLRCRALARNTEVVVAHKKVAIVLSIFAIFVGAAAAVAATLNWDGHWAVALGLACAGFVALAGLVREVFVPWIDVNDEQRRRTAEARALELLLIRDGDRMSLMVLNTSDHAVNDVRVDCHPISNPGHVAWPEPTFDPAAGRPGDEIEHSSIPPFGQSITVKRLVPGDEPDQATGPTLGSYLVSGDVRTNMEFKVTWLDNFHTRHSLIGAVDLREIDLLSYVKLDPPSPPTTRPTWWWRMRTRLQRNPA
jgi:hypothetical protein